MTDSCGGGRASLNSTSSKPQLNSLSRASPSLEKPGNASHALRSTTQTATTRGHCWTLRVRSMNGWYQIFFYDPEGNVIEVHLDMNA